MKSSGETQAGRSINEGKKGHLSFLATQAADRDERHGPFLPKRDYEDEVQCDSNLSPSPLLKHYLFLQCPQWYTGVLSIRGRL
jgi:hypothetical protein